MQFTKFLKFLNRISKIFTLLNAVNKFEWFFFNKYNFFQTDKLIGVDTPPTSTEHSTINNSITSNSNHNNNRKNDNLKTGLSLDACVLAKQNMPQTQKVTQKKPYVNVNTGAEAKTGNGVIPNGPYSIQNQTNTVYMNNNANLNDSEINCWKKQGFNHKCKITITPKK